MDTTGRKLYPFVVIGLISCSMLMYEILLTRVCALRLYFHFGFLVVSNCLLGIGASGALITVFQNRLQRNERLWIFASCVLYLLSAGLAYGFMLKMNLEPGVTFESLREVLEFATFNFVAAVPFFFSGATVGMILTFNANRVNRIYCTDLLGAGIGCLLSPLLLAATGAGGCLVFLALIALLAAGFAAPESKRALVWGGVAVLGIIALILLPTLDRRFPVPSKDKINLTGDLELDIGKRYEFSKWSAISRVDLVKVAPEQRFLFGRGRRSLASPLPEQMYISQDGSAGTFISNFSDGDQGRAGLEVLSRSAYAAASHLKPNARVFIIGVGGGNDVWAAKSQGASHVRGIELNQQILDIHREQLATYSRGIARDPTIALIAGEGRGALLREDQKYSVIQMTGVDTWTSLTSGAYMLAENYLYTVEAFEDMWDRLSDGGIIQATRFAREMETLRLLANVHAMFKTRGATEFENSVAVIFTWPLVTVLVRKGPFPPEELDKLERFVEADQMDMVYHPRMTIPTFLDSPNAIEAFIRSSDKERLIAEYPRNISPTPDDRPYFFNFTRWSQLLSSRKLIKEPDHVSQGNPFFIVGQVIATSIIALLLILSPLMIFRRRGMSRAGLGRSLVFFSAVGLGFIAIEIVLMQKLVLFLGHPLYSITVTLFTMLTFTGLGSLASARWLERPSAKTWLVPGALLVLIVAFYISAPALVRSAIQLPGPMRVATAIAVIAPIAFILGVPFAYGIRTLNRVNPSIIPWAWAVNACSTVIGSVVTVVLSMTLGFNAVLLLSVAIYFAGFAALSGIAKAD